MVDAGNEMEADVFDAFRVLPGVLEELFFKFVLFHNGVDIVVAGEMVNEIPAHAGFGAVGGITRVTADQYFEAFCGHVARKELGHYSVTLLSKSRTKKMRGRRATPGSRSFSRKPNADHSTRDLSTEISLEISDFSILSPPVDA